MANKASKAKNANKFNKASKTSLAIKPSKAIKAHKTIKQKIKENLWVNISTIFSEINAYNVIQDNSTANFAIISTSTNPKQQQQQQQSNSKDRDYYVARGQKERKR